MPVGRGENLDFDTVVVVSINLLTQIDQGPQGAFFSWYANERAPKGLMYGQLYYSDVGF